MTIAELERAIVAHQRAYDAGAPVISDDEFDALVERLRSRSPDSKVLTMVGFAARFPDSAVKHEPLMLSLGKVYDLPALTKWWKSTNVQGLQRAHGDPRTLAVVQPKLDGIAVSLIYRNGVLQNAATRGDGREGDTIRGLAARLVELPAGIPCAVQEKRELVVRGELVIPKSIFDAEWSDTYATPRNMIAGVASASGRSVSTGVLKGVRFIAYDCFGPGVSARPYSSKYTRLAELGFVIPETVEVRSFDELHVAMTREWDVDFELDGVVAKIEDADLRNKLGETDHHPRWAIAWKYQGLSGTTELVAVEWAVSRSGAIAPVAIMEPVDLGGVTVTRATLHNAATVVDLCPTIGATLQITRRGGVIPHVESVSAPSLQTTKIELPRGCPSCGHTVSWRGVNLVCMNSECRGIWRGQIHHWCKTTGMLGIGPETIDKLVDTCGVAEIADLYTLRVSTLRDAGFGAKQTAIILEEIEKTMVLDAAVFLTALGVAGLGRVAARELADHFDWETLSFRTGTGATKRATKAKIALTTMRPRITRILAYVRIEDPQGLTLGDVAPDSPFAGQLVVFTGALASMDRHEAWDLVRRHGGATHDALTRSTTMLVVGDNASPLQLSKRTKAADYNSRGIAKIALLTETDFLELVKQADDIASRAS